MSIAPLPHASAPVPAQYLEFLEALKATGFEGDVDTDHASRGTSFQAVDRKSTRLNSSH